LESLAAQSRPPDELVVVDDASDDSTPAIVEAFARRAPFLVHFQRNSTRLGVAANFTRAIARCTGELIATCDQDDIWHPDRLARAKAAFGSPDVLLAFSDAELVDAALKPLGRTLWQSVDFTAPDRAAFARGDALSVLLGKLVVTGSTMTVRGDFARAALPPAEGWIHDEWLAVMAALSSTGRLVPITELLVRYRQHGGNQIGAGRSDVAALTARGLAGGRRERVRAQLAKWTALRAQVPSSADPDKLAQLDARIAHLRVRAELASGLAPRLRTVLREWRGGGYATGARGNWSALQDLLG
jgi:hypothetical protein